MNDEKMSDIINFMVERSVNDSAYPNIVINSNKVIQKRSIRRNDEAGIINLKVEKEQYQ